MSSKFSNKFLIPENFPKILHDFIREIIRYHPKDILDFSIQYFYYQEKILPLNYIDGGSNSIPKITIKKSQNERAESNYSDGKTNFSTINKFYKNQENDDEKKFSQNITPLNFSEINNKKIDEDEEGEKKATDRKIENKSHTTFSEISGSDFEKKEVRNFADELFSECKKDAIEKLENNLNVENKNSGDKRSTFSGISCTESQKQGIRDFFEEVVKDSMLDAKEKLKNKL